MALRKELSYGGVGREGNYQGETAKARDRRLREGWFQKFIIDPGIDIGCGIDPINDTFDRWDAIYGDGDATFMDGIPDEHYMTVISSHLLEHLHDVKEAVSNWWRILKPGGHLIIVVPHRDLFEEKKELPSLRNSDHKWFWLPMEQESPCTLSLSHVIRASTGQDSFLLRTLDQNGEYSIEAIVQKP